MEDLRNQRFVDMTHTFYPGIPHAPDMPDQTMDSLYNFESDGFQAHQYSFPGQWGTHVDPPIHFEKEGRTLDQISVKDMLLPLVCIDCIDKVASDSDFLLNLEDVIAWESIYGNVPEDSFCIMKTGWSDRWPESDAMYNKDSKGVAHFPGWGMEAVKYLVECRRVKAFGHETIDTDGGISVTCDDYSVEAFILKNDCFQIELLANTSSIPPTGSLASVTFPKPRGGSGFPARVYAICPE